MNKIFKKKDTSIPKVSIGLPVYNGADVLDKAIKSLLSQTHQNFELIISDNASSDKTEEICKNWLLIDSRIRYFRQSTNLGPLNNFEFVLKQSFGEYFMWTACDDEWSKSFIEKNLMWLESNPDYVGSISAASNGNNTDPIKAGATTFDSPCPNHRILQFARSPGANSRFYSLFRRNELLDLELSKFNYWAGDWSIIIHLLAKGKLKCHEGEIGFFKNADGASSNVIKLRDQMRVSKIEYIIPFFFFCKCIFQHTKPDIYSLFLLLKLNYKAAKGYFRDKIKQKIF